MIIFGLCPSVIGQGQIPPAPSSTPSLEKEFLKNILRDQKAIWTAPTKLQKGDTKLAVLSGIGTMALFTTDRITGDEIAECNKLAKPSRFVSYPGSTYGVGAIAASFYFAGRKTNNYRARETGILTAEAAIDSLIVASALKGITQRGRPEIGRERSEFFDGGSSFPSGHGAQAWAAATIIASEYHDHRVVQIVAYGVATAVSVARFTGGKHYVSDALVGSVLGYGIGKYVYNAHHRAPTAADDSGMTVSRWPMFEPRFNRQARQYGIGLTWNF